MSKGKIYTISSALFYLAFGGLVAAGLYYSPSGPCTPGWGILLFMLTPVPAGIGLLLSAGFRLYGRQAWTGPLVIHGLILISWILLLWFLK